MMKLEWSPNALDDLDSIYEVIALDDGNAAERFIKEIRAKARTLLATPKIGIRIEEVNNDAVRIHEVYNQRRIYIRTYNRE